ncbi:MAG: restriction endonuclease subunit S, partial [Pyrinomonadaceae bacterium]
MERLLKNIATIKAGYSFRGSIPANENGNCRIIQIKDIDYDAFISGNGLVKAEIDSIKPEYLADEGDVLFTSRGANRRAGVVGAQSANAVFVSQLYALKIKTGDISPEYLAWYINQPPA